MKKLLITFLILLSPLVSAQTDDFCRIFTDAFGWEPIRQEIKTELCKRDDVLYLYYVGESNLGDYLHEQSSRWCRFDRDRLIVGRTLSCVLASTQPRV